MEISYLRPNGAGAQKRKRPKGAGGQEKHSGRTGQSKKNARFVFEWHARPGFFLAAGAWVLMGPSYFGAQARGFQWVQAISSIANHIRKSMTIQLPGYNILVVVVFSQF